MMMNRAIAQRDNHLRLVEDSIASDSALLADSKMSDHSVFRKEKLLMLNTVVQKGIIAEVCLVWRFPDRMSCVTFALSR